MLVQIGQFLVDTVATLFVLLLLARFHFQWLRVPFRNPVGEFVLATTSWLVVPVRRLIPALAGLDSASLALAWLVQGLGIWLQAVIVGADPAVLALGAVALVDLVRYSLYIMSFAVIVQALMSWINPYTPLAPVFDALTRPLLRPLRRLLPPIANVDLTPLVVLVLLQAMLIPIAHLRAAAAGL